MLNSLIFKSQYEQVQNKKKKQVKHIRELPSQQQTTPEKYGYQSTWQKPVFI